MTISYIGVIGAGAWGTALAQSVHRAGCGAVLWCFEPGVEEVINRTHENNTYLPGIKLDAGIRATAILDEAAATDAIFLAVLIVLSLSTAGYLTIEPLFTLLGADEELVDGLNARGLLLRVGLMDAHLVEEHRHRRAQVVAEEQDDDESRRRNQLAVRRVDGLVRRVHPRELPSAALRKITHLGENLSRIKLRITITL